MDGSTRQTLQLTVTDTQPFPHFTTTPSSSKPMQLRPRPRSRKQEGGKVSKSDHACAKIAWTYDMIMECCGRF